jgi:serpin B
MKYIALFFLLFVNTVSAQELVVGQNRFGFELYGQVADVKKNSCISPYSISSALTLAHAGSDGQTKSQIAAVLGFPPEQSLDALHAEINTLKTFLAPVISSAEAVAIDANFHPLSGYLTTVQKKLGAEIFEVDTNKNTQEAISRINQWVSGKTKGLIPSLLQVGDIDEQTKMVLLNAVYLKALWTSPFLSQDTKESNFYTPSREKIRVSMMHKNETMALYQDDQYYAVWQEMRPEVKEVTAASPQLETIIILPREENARDLELSSEKLASWRQKAKRQSVDLYVPKCSVRMRSELKQPLQNLGMTDAFTNDADFSLIHPGNVLKVSSVIHEAFIQMDESGIEAAAATAVIMAVKSALVEKKMPVVVRCDSPFYVVIREKKSGLVLFVSYIATPEKIVVRS